MSGPDLPAKVHDEFRGARREALYRRVRAEGAGADEETIRKKLLPRTDPLLETTADRAFRSAFARSAERTTTSAR